MRLLLTLALLKQLQVNGVGHRLVAGVGWVRVVSTVVNYKQPRRGVRVAQYSIEVDHPVIHAAQADPRVDRLALDFVRGREGRERGSRDKKPFKRSQGAAVDF